MAASGTSATGDADGVEPSSARRLYFAMPAVKRFPYEEQTMWTTPEQGRVWYEVIDLPERAHEALGHLGEMRGMMASICGLVARSPELQDPAELGKMFKGLRELNRTIDVPCCATIRINCIGPVRD
jgi:hypothetical protein